MIPTLQKYYKETVVPALQEQLGLSNVNQVPKLTKIVVTTHVGYAQAERKNATEDAVEEISRITGQNRAWSTLVKVSRTSRSVQEKLWEHVSP